MANRRELCAHIRIGTRMRAMSCMPMLMSKFPCRRRINILLASLKMWNILSILVSRWYLFHRHSSLTSWSLSEANILVMTEVKQSAVRYARAHSWLLNISCFFILRHPSSWSLFVHNCKERNEHGMFVEQTPEKRTSMISETNKERIDIEVSDDQSKREEEAEEEC